MYLGNALIVTINNVKGGQMGIFLRKIEMKLIHNDITTHQAPPSHHGFIIKKKLLLCRRYQHLNTHNLIIFWKFLSSFCCCFKNRLHAFILSHKVVCENDVWYSFWSKVSFSLFLFLKLYNFFVFFLFSCVQIIFIYFCANFFFLEFGKFAI